MTGVFQKWQPVYAERGIATFPVREVGENKKPMVSHYQRIGLHASAQLVSRFGSAAMLGFVTGKRSGITVLDVDSVNDNDLAEALDRQGQTPVIARTARGKFHAFYKHNGEGRKIRPWPDRQIDVLGNNGFVVGTPSLFQGGEYQFIQGSLDDLGSLPVLRDPPGAVPKVQSDRRNETLFRQMGRAAHHVDNFEQLLDYGRTRNEEFSKPLEDDEVIKTAKSVWKYQCEGRNWFGQIDARIPRETANKLAAANSDALALLTVLKANHGPDQVFAIANAMANSTLTMGWRRFAEARRVLIEAGLVQQVSPDTQRKSAQYRWPLPRVTKVGSNNNKTLSLSALHPLFYSLGGS
jgi:hypothetical protein